MKNDSISYDEIITSSLDYSNIKNDFNILADDIYTKVKKGFQVMLEKIIGEEFMNFLNQIALEWWK